MIKLLSITSCDPNVITGYVEREEDYAEFVLVRGREPTFHNAVSKVLFRTYKHYTDTLGKFTPGTYFLSDPLEVMNLDFDQLAAIFEEIPEFRVFRREGALNPELN